MRTKRLQIPIYNNSGASLGVRLEPWCDEMELAPGEEAEVTLEMKGASDTLAIQIDPENFLSLWVPAGATIKLRS